MKRSHAGFTLVELLVVIAIIIALLAILMPSMGKAIDAAHRAVCGSQLSQAHIAHLGFANDHFGQFTPGQVVTDGVSKGTFMVWAPYLTSYVPNAPHNRYRGNGYLVRAGYLNNPQALYCPSSTHPSIYFGGPSGWPDDGQHPEAAGMDIVQTSYHYRSSFEGPNWRAARLSIDQGGDVLLADHFSGAGWAGVEYWHKTGYNYATIGGSVSWQEDVDQEIRNHNGGASYNVATSGYLLQEEVFNELIGRL